jgi:4-aminobutyrate aminotransferase-like enzyme
MKPTFSQNHQPVATVRTAHRKIQGSLPVAASLPLLESLRRHQPRSVDCQPPLVWDRAEGIHVFDPYGNQWLDFTSGVLVANIGHNHPEVVRAAAQEVLRGNLFSYCFPSQASTRLAERLVDLLPVGLDKVFLLTTGSETTECAIKHCRLRARQIDPDKKVIVTFHNAFHGRTLGAQLAGGSSSAKGWIGNLDVDFVQVPFPDGYRCDRRDFGLFLESLAAQNVAPDRIAGVMMESYQGGGAAFAPAEYVQALAAFCRAHDALLVFDEVQSGFGRTGRLFAFEYYGVTPDLVCLGKAISGSLPLAALAGRAELLDLCNPGEMTSTHGGNPVACAAALANLDILVAQRLTEHAAEMEAVFTERLDQLAREFPNHIGAWRGRGMVCAIDVVTGLGSKEPNHALAHRVIEECFRRGLLIFAPVGFGGGGIKLCPPLLMEAAALHEGFDVLRESFAAAVAIAQKLAA